jgi:hypothetical protein
VASWTNLVSREIPHLREEELRPVAIVDQGTVPGAQQVVWIDTQAQFEGEHGLVGDIFAYAHSEESQDVAISLRGRRGKDPWMLWVNGENRLPRLSPGRTAVFRRARRLDSREVQD